MCNMDDKQRAGPIASLAWNPLVVHDDAWRDTLNDDTGASEASERVESSRLVVPTPLPFVRYVISAAQSIRGGGFTSLFLLVYVIIP